ncbi:hypothetical protein [Arsukibacterium sp.]|uniref:hypothetical protein n=1 Tax=Arsukibacterium sp. TaxID=1977258 RepID=UPI001BD330A4|nr:hypothetical protein [Arsukibacterium sp.]
MSIAATNGKSAEKHSLAAPKRSLFPLFKALCSEVKNETYINFVGIGAFSEAPFALELHIGITKQQSLTLNGKDVTLDYLQCQGRCC